MKLGRRLLYFTSFIVLFWLNIESVCCNEQRNNNEIPYYNSFIAARMKHLTAINNLKELSSAVKRHQLILDMLKTIFKVLDETRRAPAIRNSLSVDITEINPHYLQDIFQYMENTAFLCDFLIFFPEVTVKLLDNNLLWRIMLIDSVQDAMSNSLEFIDKNTQNQFRKANEILSKENIPEEVHPSLSRKSKETQKKKRKPRLTADEL